MLIAQHRHTLSWKFLRKAAFTINVTSDNRASLVLRSWAMQSQEHMVGGLYAFSEEGSAIRMRIYSLELLL
jgi:hypothetical protein